MKKKIPLNKIEETQLLQREYNSVMGKIQNIIEDEMGFYKIGLPKSEGNWNNLPIFTNEEE